MAASQQRDQRLYFYDSIASEFDRIANPYDLQRRLEVVFDDLLAGIELSGKRVLDVGSGTGWFSQRARAEGAQVTAVDIGLRLLAEVRAKSATTPVNADACALPFRDEVFDVVLSSECIEHTLDPLRAVAEMTRVVKRGGTVALTTPNLWWRWSATVAHVLRLRPYDGYEHWVSRSAVRRALARQGLRVERTTGFHLVPPLVRATWPALRSIDRRGQYLAPVMLNFGVVASKP